MSLSDPSLTPLGATTAVTPKQQAQAREMFMNSSMMYMHEVRILFFFGFWLITRNQLAVFHIV